MSDPTRTLTLRNKITAETNRRYNQLKGLVNASIITNRVFHANADPLPRNAFLGLTESESIAAWNVWLAVTINEVILEVPPTTPLEVTPPFDALRQQWLIASILEGYRRGAVSGNARLRLLDSDIGTININAPKHITASQIIANRDYTALKGITRTMSDQMTRVLTQGLLEGQGATEIARNLNNRIDKIGKVRSRLLSRTEIVFANNLAGTIDDEIAEDILGEEIVERWVTAGDEKVRGVHVGRDGNYYTIGRARELIGEPNCRCTLVASLKSDLPEGTRILS